MADLYGTYSHRYEITIDHTEIDSDLDWFPITVHLNDTDHEELFNELTSADDFDRIAFTTSDEETELYADCELFDVTNKVAIFHVSKDGWTISSSADTKYYLYFDSDAAHNTTYVSKSGDTAAQSVWDGSFKAVYHMNDAPEPTYDTEYDGSVEPDSDGWTLGGDDYASSDGDILTIDTTADSSYQCYYYKEPDVDFDAGFYLKTRLQYDSSDTGYIKFEIKDGTQDERANINIFKDKVDVWGEDGKVSENFDFSDDYHILEIYVKGTTEKIYVDGDLKISTTVTSVTTDDFVTFGDTRTDNTTKVQIDYFNYALDIGYNPAAGIIDSTSNANHGDKKASGEPAEATGKVGKGQDFDGTDDYVDIGDDLTYQETAITQEIIINPESVYTGGDWQYNNTVAAESNHIYISLDESSGEIKTIFIDQDGNNDGWQMTGTTPSTGTDYHIAHVVDAANNKQYVYVDNVEKIDNDYTFTSIGLDSGKIHYIGYVDYNRYFDGVLDEYRLSTTARSAAWIAATYKSLWDTLQGFSYQKAVDISGDLIFSGILQKTAFETLSGTLNFTGDLAKSLVKIISLEGNLVFSGVLEYVKSIFKSLQGDLNFTGVTVKTVFQFIQGNINFIGDLTKKLIISKILSGALNLSGSVRKLLYKTIIGMLNLNGTVTKKLYEAFKGKLNFIGEISKKPIKVLAGVLNFSGEVNKWLSKTLAGSVYFTGNLVKSTYQIIYKALSGSLYLSGQVSKSLVRHLSLIGNLVFSGQVFKGLYKTLSGNIYLSGAVSAFKGMWVTLSGNLNLAGELVRQTFKQIMLEGMLNLSGEITKWAKKYISLSGAINFVGDLSITKYLYKVLTGSVNFAGDLVTSVYQFVSKVLAGSINFTGDLTRKPIKVLAGSISFIGGLNVWKSISKVIEGALNFLGEIAKQIRGLFTKGIIEIQSNQSDIDIVENYSTIALAVNQSEISFSENYSEISIDLNNSQIEIYGGA